VTFGTISPILDDDVVILVRDRNRQTEEFVRE